MAISHRCSNSIVSSDIRRMFEGKWNWTALSRVIPLVDVRRYPNLPWSKEGLSRNPTLSVSDIQSLSEIDGEWNWNEISSRIPLSDVRRYPSLPWDKTGLSYNPTLTVDDIESLTEIDGLWVWTEISRRVPLVEVRRYPNLLIYLHKSYICQI